MKDPPRLIDDLHAPPVVRRVLRAEGMRPVPEALRRSVFTAIASQVTWTGAAAAGTSGGAAAGAAAKGTQAAAWATTSGLFKFFAVGVGIGSLVAVGGPAIDGDSGAPSSTPATIRAESARVGGAGALAAPRRVQDEPTARALSPSARPHRERGESRVPNVAGRPSGAAPQPEPAMKPADSVSEEVAAPAKSRAVHRAREEAVRVSEARRALRRGQGAVALNQLAELDREMPSGVLMQEREALRIEALAAAGRRGDAERAATQFLERYPESPHTGRVRATIEFGADRFAEPSP